MSIAIIIILLLYCLFVVWLIVGWLKTKHKQSLPGEPHLFYSLIVPFRNEANQLPKLINSLKQLNFPHNRFEVLLIDDHSDDDYESILKDLPGNVSVIKADDEEGKKAALAKGINSAKGDVIVTTDADCLVPNDWLRYYAQCFEEQDAQLAFGGVAFAEPNTFFQKLQQIEFSSLIGSGAATLAWGFPTMSNGANFAFLKKTFNEVEGYADNISIPSGDDEFLLHKVYKKYPDKVFFIKNKETVVQTSAMDNLHTFFDQRRRWASKWKYYSSIKNTILPVLVLLFNLAVLTSFLSFFMVYEFKSAIAAFLFSKLLLEGIFLKMILKTLGRKLYFIPFLFLQITYPLYVIIFGITANFGRYHWKGRTHKL